MKHAFTKGLFVAATATLIAACSTDDAADQMPVAPGKIEVSLKAALPQSRAQIEVDESNGRFSGSWEATDELTVYAKGSTSGEETPKFTYDADAKVFKGQLTEKKQDWTYQAVYPAVDATPLNIPFGAERTQKGSNFNGAYDPLVSALVTHDGAEPGKTPQGEAVTFGLKRLTAILALTFKTDDATVKAEKVKSVALTAAGKTIAAKSFDITLDDQSGALNTDGQSETITLSYEAGSEPAAASFKAYFNVPAATYGKLSVVITTEGHTASLDLTTDGIELLPGELAYTTKAVSGWTALAAAPTIVYNNDVNLWTNKATFTLSDIPSNASSIAVKYKATDSSEWLDADVKGTIATASPEWEGPFTTVETSPNSTVTPYYRQKTATGIRNGKTYEYKLIVDGNEYAGATTFSANTKEANGEIPSLDNAQLSCYDWDKCNTDDTWWASGNCVTKMFIEVTTTCLKYENNAAKLVSSKPLAIVKLSAGNLFTGKFKKADATTGVASFGVNYSWNVRPTGIKFSYYGAVAQGNLQQQHGKQVTSAENDYARVYAAIIDWSNSKPRAVSSGSKAPTGTWDPEIVDNSTHEPTEVETYGGGKVIAYASYWIDKNNMPAEFSTKTLQFNWYDKEAKPTDGNLSLIISCASNAYGDFMCGYDGNYMYIKDFEWVY